MPVIENILINEEAFNGYIYDDATGNPIRPGSVLKGHPTVGYGLALDVNPLTEEEGRYLLRNRIAGTESLLAKSLPWFADLDETRRAVLTAMAYQLGAGGLLEFRGLLHYCAIGDWNRASEQMLNSRWASQTPARVTRMALIMRTGIVSGIVSGIV
jgi:lysozyme